MLAPKWKSGERPEAVIVEVDQCLGTVNAVDVGGAHDHEADANETRGQWDQKPVADVSLTISRCDLNDGQQLDEYRQDLDRCYGYRYRSPGLKCDEGMVSSPTAMLPRIRLRSGRAGLVDELTIY